MLLFRPCLRSNVRRHELHAQRVVGDARRLLARSAAYVCLLKSASITRGASIGATVQSYSKVGFTRAKFTTFDAET
jgi:hypothetical protein